MTRSSRIPLLILVAGASLAPAWTAATAEDATAPTARRVVAAYFHRTQRCPTCLKVGDAIERALRENFATELQDGRLASRHYDFQDPANASYVSAFGITSPTFLILVVEGNRVVAWKPAPRTWGLLGDPAAFSRYVQAEIRGVLPPPVTAGRESNPNARSR